eukprot:TRINITY_DN3902_c0_g4_i1.p1 TRINITY_DN3902_c0_g4~~TRINITY_DN3902_c0_g4_i1.p1  ORF type:complete len:212 (+),score=49.21 TRINITY_DN3902_c0_g4_i1:275-910(+)
MGCCESDEEETQALVNDKQQQQHRTPQRGLNVQGGEVPAEPRYSQRPDSYNFSTSIPVLPVISPMKPVQDRTLNSILAQSIPGSLQEASFIAPTAMEEDMERYEAVVDKAMKEFIDLSQLHMENTSSFLYIPERIEIYQDNLNEGCLRNNTKEPADLIYGVLSKQVNVTAGASDSDAAILKFSMETLLSVLGHISVEDKGPLLGSLSEEEP